MHYKEIDGVRFYAPGLMHSHLELAIERWTRMYLKFFLGAAIVALAWVWSGAFHHTDYQAYRDYATQYLNNQ